MNEKVKILAITGAKRDESRTNQLAYIAKEYFNKEDVELTVFDQSTTPLPLYDGKISLNTSNVQKLLRLAREADGYVLVSPEYHGSMSGAIKNALDWLDFLEDIDFFHGKVVGIIGGGGALGNAGATIQLMMAIRALHGWLMPDVVVNVQRIKEGILDGELSNDTSKQRMQMFAEKLTNYTKMFKENRKYFYD